MRRTAAEQMAHDRLHIGDRVTQTAVGGFGAGNPGQLADVHGTLILHNGAPAVRLDNGRIARYWAAWYKG